MENGLEKKTRLTLALGHSRWKIFSVQRRQWASSGAPLLLALILLTACPVAWSQKAIKTGPEVGSMLPAFEAPDQNGRPQNLKTILGPKGALLVFFRSADW